MSSFKKALILSLLGVLSADARFGSPSSPQDLFADPKYAVEFYNERPVAKSVAAGWMADAQSMDGWGDTDKPEGSLVQLRLSPPSAQSGEQTYLCLLPPPPAPSPSTRAAEIAQAQEEQRVDPIKGWQALGHLEDKCIYSKQGWFTYAYCHNSHIRQFRAAKHAPPHPPSGYVPEEDLEYDAYTLGRAVLPSSSNEASRRSEAPALSYGHSHSARYLLQRLTLGTMCDKTGRPRETEVQFHCSMTHADSIYLVKELATCSYVLVIHSPHLCELPGFKPETAVGAVEGIKCRLVVGDDDVVHSEGPGQASKKPLGRDLAPPAIAPPPAPVIRKVDKKGSKRGVQQAKPKIEKDAKPEVEFPDPLEQAPTDGRAAELGDLEHKLARSEAALDRLIELLHLGPEAQGEIELTELLEEVVGGDLVSDEERDEVAEGSKMELLRSLLASVDAQIEIRIEEEEEADEQMVRDEL